MRPSSVRALAVCALVSLFAAAGLSHMVPPTFALTNGGSITALGVPLTENFDTLASAGTNITWTDNSTIPGWYSTRATYNSGTGSSNTGALYSFGVAGTNPVTDRALGSVASGTTPDCLPGGQADEQHGRDDCVARHQLRRRAVAQRRKRDRPHAHLPIPGRQRRHRHRRERSDDRLDDVRCRLSFTGPVTGCDGRDARRQRAGQPHRQIRDAHGDGQPPDRKSGYGGRIPMTPEAITAWRSTIFRSPRPAPAMSRLRSQHTTPANVGDERPGRLEHRHQLQRERQRDRECVQPAMPGRLAGDAVHSERHRPASSFTLDPTVDLPVGTVCTVTVERGPDHGYRHGRSAGQHGGGLHLLVHHGAARTTAPAVTSDDAGERRDRRRRRFEHRHQLQRERQRERAVRSRFSARRARRRHFTQSASPASSFTLTPTSPLPVQHDLHGDGDGEPDHRHGLERSARPDGVGLHASRSRRLRAGAGNVIINEIDADTPGNPTRRSSSSCTTAGSATRRSTVWWSCFYDGGLSPFTGKQSYAAFDLDGYSTDANGYFVLGNPGVPAAASDFRSGPVRAAAERTGRGGALRRQRDGLPERHERHDDESSRRHRVRHRRCRARRTCCRCSTPDSLTSTKTPTELARTQSSQRCPNGMGGTRNTFRLSAGHSHSRRRKRVPPPHAPPSDVVISQIYGGGGNSGATYHNDYVELYNRGVASVDLSGWSLQYASSAGSGWDFNQQPLGGTIGAGEYYLIALASGGATGRTATRREHHRTNQYERHQRQGRPRPTASTADWQLSARQRPRAGLRRLWKRRLPERGATTAPSLSNTTAAIPSGERQHRHRT